MTSSRLIPPRAGAGRPGGREPTVGSAVVRFSAAVSAMAATTAISTPGSFHGRKRHDDDDGDGAGAEQQSERIDGALGHSLGGAGGRVDQ